MANCSHCDVHEHGSVPWLICVVECELDDNGNIINGNALPLTGASKQAFEANANDASNRASDAQEGSFFSGLTPNVLSRPPGQSYQEWFESISSNALTIVTSSSPTTDQRQQALDSIYTIEQKKAEYVAEYT